SNAAGTYCSWKCRNDGYAGFHRGRPAYGYRYNRSRWTWTAKRFRKAGNDFCCACGRIGGRLMVHHIEPYRMRQNNEHSNLVTLCSKCHQPAERLSDRIEALPAECGQVRAEIFKARMEERRMAWRSLGWGLIPSAAIRKIRDSMASTTSKPSRAA